MFLNSKIWHILGTLFLCLSFAARAQYTAPRRFPLTENSQPVKINCTYKTKLGLIFTGTDNGVYRFDGAVYHPVKFRDSIINARVTALFEDVENILWVGFANGAIARKINNRLVVFSPEEGTPKKPITAFINDRDKDLWFSTDGEGIYYFKGTHLYNINTEDGLSDEHVHALQTAANGEILAATDQGINICRIDNLKKNIRNINSKKGLPDNMVTCMIYAGNDRFWVGLQNSGFCLYDHNFDQVVSSSDKWTFGQINALANDKNILLAITEEGGLLRFTIPPNGIFNFEVQDSLSVKSPISSVLWDDEGNVWMNIQHEMLRTNGERLKLMEIADKQQIRNIKAIMIDQNNFIWMAKESSISCYDIRKINSPLKTFQLPANGSHNNITSLYQDRFGIIWIGTMGKGIFLYDPATGKSRKLQENPLLVNANVLSITGKDNAVNVSSFEDISAFILTQANDTLQNPYYYIDYKNIKSIGSNYVYSIFTDSRNRLWFATDGKGITVLDKGVYTNYNENDGLKNTVIYSITEDRKGNIWFSTASSGIYKFDGKKFTNYSGADGLNDLNIANIKTDKAGNIVIVNRKGLDILDPETGNIFSLNKEHGINSIREDPSFVTEDTGRNIYFCTENGIGIYNAPDNRSTQPKTFIENISLFLDDLGPNPTHLFSYDQNNITFHYFGLHYSSPEKIHYQYILEGYDTKWVNTKNDEASFAKLPPAKYRFRVRSSLSYNFSNADEAVFEFRILPPVWLRWWFILLVTLVTASLIAYYIRWREKNLKNIQQLKEEKIFFQLQELRNQINPHFLFNSFNTLISTIEDNPKNAIAYAEHLSDFFRNLITYKDKDLISLKEELGLMKNYLYLQQKRYGDNLHFNVDADIAQQEQIYIPPLTLQLLTENAIKHNIISRDKPLFIEIFLRNGYIVIRNNINKPINKQAGTGMGLQNIMGRYNLLSSKKVMIEKHEEFFIVSLPFLKYQHE